MRGIAWQAVRCVAWMAAIVSLDLAVMAANLRYTVWSENVWCAVALAVQVGLASVWFAIGRDQLFPRLLVWLTALGTGWTWLLTWHELAETEMTPAFAVQAASVTGILFLMRVAGFETVRDRQEVPAVPTPYLPKFSILGVLLLTGFIGAVVAVVLRMQSLQVRTQTVAISCFCGAFLATLTLAAVLATLTARNPLALAPLVCTGGALLGAGTGLALHYIDMMFAVIALVAPVSIQAVVLLAARMAGYRFVRAGRATGQT